MSSITLPYSINAIDGHSSGYAKGTYNFTTTIELAKVQPTRLWFQHADQSATVYVDDTLVSKHWGGYNAFFVDITNYIHTGINNIKVAIKNNEGNVLAPFAGDFNFNATLGNVRLESSPVLPSALYGYDGFHITSTVTTASAIVNVKTNIPAGADVICKISDSQFSYSEKKPSTGNEMTFTTTISNPHLWNGTLDPHLYTVTLEIYYNGDLYHRYTRPYGLRYYEYAINGSTPSGQTGITYNGNTYTGFLLNGQPYLLRGVCMHDDIAGKANALNNSDYVQEFAIIQELNCNFIRLAHYPHPKEVYDKCDELGIIVQTEVPCVNRFRTPDAASDPCPQDYYDHLYIQYEDMVRQHYNHPCIMFWGLFNEATTNNSSWAKTQLEAYRTFIKNIDSERWVGYVVSQCIGGLLAGGLLASGVVAPGADRRQGAADPFPAARGADARRARGDRRVLAIHGADAAADHAGAAARHRRGHSHRAADEPVITAARAARSGGARRARDAGGELHHSGAALGRERARARRDLRAGGAARHLGEHRGGASERGP